MSLIIRSIWSITAASTLMLAEIVGLYYKIVLSEDSGTHRPLGSHTSCPKLQIQIHLFASKWNKQKLEHNYNIGTVPVQKHVSAYFK